MRWRLQSIAKTSIALHYWTTVVLWIFLLFEKTPFDTKCILDLGCNVLLLSWNGDLFTEFQKDILLVIESVYCKGYKDDAREFYDITENDFQLEVQVQSIMLKSILTLVRNQLNFERIEGNQRKVRGHELFMIVLGKLRWFELFLVHPDIEALHREALVNGPNDTFEQRRKITRHNRRSSRGGY